ncbi:aminoglycoside phosphotransferase family protein [Mycobacterium spongiae]|uniref:Phosphotransferase n=1 Tax=Mycobacterium spongiae TaxID=886343 RepID=A0A975JWN7_9MYCO|nr:aminoglycoside phosphotransferase family protein [Mycobacterium spongiae]QUR67051.1 phosphotransferase [Mycobacterium spongiae]
MHGDEAAVDSTMVARLLAAQFPRWSELPLARVESAGTDHAIYRLGTGLCVRLPRTPSASGQVHKEHQWLPRLAQLVPLSIPAPLALGKPGEGYPWHWSVYDWLEGHTLDPGGITDIQQVAHDLASFVAALHRIDLAGGPAPGVHNFFRGVPLAARDAATRKAIAELSDEVDTAAAIAAWEAALRAAPWQGPGVWIHGDLSSGNLLFQQGRLAGVIDFGGVGVGDPACDFSVAWELFPAAARDAFRTALAADPASWNRGRGWALSIAAIQLPYYQDTNPMLAHRARKVIAEVLMDYHQQNP